MSRPGLRPMLAVAAVVALTTLAGCSGSDTGGPSDITLPSSLSITTTVPGDPGTTVAVAPPTTEVPPPTTPAAEGAPVITALRAEPGADGCVAGTIPAVVTFTVAEQPPARIFSVFLDSTSTAAGSSSTMAPITIPAIPCDGIVHRLVLIATGADGQSSTRAVAFRSPRPA